MTRMNFAAMVVAASITWLYAFDATGAEPAVEPADTSSIEGEGSSSADRSVPPATSEDEGQATAAWKWSPCNFDTFVKKVFVVVDVHASLLSDAEDRKPLGDSFGYAVKAGWRFGRLGVFASFEHNLWIRSELKSGVSAGVANIGIGLEVNYLHGYARTSLAIGPSVLLFDTGIDQAGSTGFFMDLRPIGLRWPITRFFALTLDPISFALVAPALDRVPLVTVQFRTTVGFEFVL
ncbi:MAG TPA: hypothetical protein PKG82_06675 [Myxococcota bacterium]|nr:hypothetical protein [Myxococcota bacterium]